MSRLALLMACAFLAGGCYVDFDANTTGFDSSSSDSFADSLEGEILKVVTDGTTAEMSCPATLTGQGGNKFVCIGETSDGYIIDVAIIEHGGGRFRWEVVASRPMP